MFILQRKNRLWVNRSTRCASLAVNQRFNKTCFSIFPLKMFRLFFLLFCCFNGVFFLSMFVTCTTLTKNNAANCKKMLDSTNATEHDDELFCRSCYGKKFGPKGYGYGGGGAGVLSMDDGTGYIVQILTLSISFSSSFLYLKLRLFIFH
jgi:hypothetical protein